MDNKPAVTAGATSVAVRQMKSPLFGLAARFNIEPDKLVEVLRGTVIKPDRNGHQATNEEVAAFCVITEQYGLNPWLREIHAFASQDKGIVPIVGIDGWTRIVNREPNYNGCEFIEVNTPEGLPITCTCRIFVKNRDHPNEVTEYFSECKRNTGPWNQMPHRMLRHKSFMQCARYAFGLSGIYDQDEANDIINVTEQQPGSNLFVTEKLKGGKPALTPVRAPDASKPVPTAGIAPNAQPDPSGSAVEQPKTSENAVPVTSAPENGQPASPVVPLTVDQVKVGLMRAWAIVGTAELIAACKTVDLKKIVPAKGAPKLVGVLNNLTDDEQITLLDAICEATKIEPVEMVKPLPTLKELFDAADHDARRAAKSAGGAEGLEWSDFEKLTDIDVQDAVLSFMKSAAEPKK